MPKLGGYRAISQRAFIRIYRTRYGIFFIDRRLKISGAQWNAGSINQMLRLRCAYLNGKLAV